MSQPLSVLIVDDEPLARDAIRSMLAGDPDVQIAGDCTGIDAVAMIARTRPDILFLDIQMPEVDGFSVLQQAGADAVPAVVFVTAFDRYALKAFEVHALDYLLKPIGDERFAEALSRAKKRVTDHRRGTIDSRIAELLSERASTQQTRFLIPARDRMIVVDAADIDWVEAADYCVSIHAGKASHLLRETMDEIERRLDPKRFARIHRSTIVNIDRVREVHPLFRGDSELVLADGTRLKLSRNRKREFDARFTHPGRR